MTVFDSLCYTRSVTGHDAYGKEQLGRKSAEKIAIVKLNITRQHTTIRADASATRGFSEEVTATSVLLFKAKSTIKLNDLIEVSGFSLRVRSKFPRFLNGKVDHFEIGASIEQ